MLCTRGPVTLCSSLHGFSCAQGARVFENLNPRRHTTPVLFYICGTGLTRLQTLLYKIGKKNVSCEIADVVETHLYNYSAKSLVPTKTWPSTFFICVSYISVFMYAEFICMKQGEKTRN